MNKRANVSFWVKMKTLIFPNMVKKDFLYTFFYFWEPLSCFVHTSFFFFNPEIFSSAFLTWSEKNHLLRWKINFSGRVWDLRSSSLRERLLLVPLSSGVFEDPVRIKVTPTQKLSSIPENTSESLTEIQLTVNPFPWNGSEGHKTSNFLKYREIKSGWGFLFLFFPTIFSPSHSQSI